MELTNRHCVPCEGGVPKLGAAAVQDLLAQVTGWVLGDGRIAKRLKFRDFAHLMAYVNRLADLAELEGHHPDFAVHYNILDVSVWTHAVNGLTENDFILAAKIDAMGGGHALS
ncbi:MAG: transcriptional coactivator/pterin dehydratase [Cyanobacteria bacterium RYN_339]|nr:transcriptional coactivator/pterin dehydratase [Cyanobacteria bacterium RYN_339]